jgi:hypothetical protein
VLPEFDSLSELCGLSSRTLRLRALRLQCLEIKAFDREGRKEKAAKVAKKLKLRTVREPARVWQKRRYLRRSRCELQYSHMVGSFEAAPDGAHPSDHGRLDYESSSAELGFEQSEELPV